jgi:hypothetical protein
MDPQTGNHRQLPMIDSNATDGGAPLRGVPFSFEDFNVNPTLGARSFLSAGKQLNVNQELIAPDGAAFLLLQGDGDLVLCRNDTGRSLWSSGGKNPTLI